MTAVAARTSAPGCWTGAQEGGAQHRTDDRAVVAEGPQQPRRTLDPLGPEGRAHEGRRRDDDRTTQGRRARQGAHPGERDRGRHPWIDAVADDADGTDAPGAPGVGQPLGAIERPAPGPPGPPRRQDEESGPRHGADRAALSEAEGGETGRPGPARDRPSLAHMPPERRRPARPTRQETPATSRPARRGRRRRAGRGPRDPRSRRPAVRRASAPRKPPGRRRRRPGNRASSRKRAPAGRPRRRHPRARRGPPGRRARWVRADSKPRTAPADRPVRPRPRARSARSERTPTRRTGAAGRVLRAR